ncbi:hypothetical protein [Micromonospora sp. CPCC 205556]|uniref:hypothetical protein n=1 Tax=Micromonospora sp. CPCC 205556 TaxID=3122398 RepID=UPI002FEF2C2D
MPSQKAMIPPATFERVVQLVRGGLDGGKSLALERNYAGVGGRGGSGPVVVDEQLPGVDLRGQLVHWTADVSGPGFAVGVERPGHSPAGEELAHL